MKIFLIGSILLLNAVFLFAQDKNTNQFTPGKIWLDNKGVHINAHGGGILFHNKMYYWFGEHKVAGDAGNKAMVGVHVYSSKNLTQWKDEGIALSVVEDTTSLLVKGCIIERPKVIYNKKTKTFVMWFHHELKGQGYKAALTGLAISKKITGPYRYIKSVNPLGQMSRDMTLYVDDDAKAYHIHSSENNQTLHFAELTDDYQDFTGRYTRVLEGKANEAPAIFKKEGKYYMISSGTTGWDPNPARLSVADHIMGPWKELGDPSRGTDAENKTTFWSQSTYILPVYGKKNAFIYMGDRWTPKNAIDGRYIWLPIQFEEGKPILKWLDQWDLSFFK